MENSAKSGQNIQKNQIYSIETLPPMTDDSE